MSWRDDLDMPIGFGNSHVHLRSPARSGMDGELASEQQRSLPHAEEPERPARSKRTFIESNAVIMNLQRQTANLTGQSDLDFGGVRVPHDVGQRFLQNAQERGGARGIQVDVGVGQAYAARDPRASLKLRCGPLHRRHETEVIQYARPELCRESA